jgi:hypothetical protein
VKQVAILLVSVVVLGLLVWVCFFPPPKLSDYTIGDEKCDICAQTAVYGLRLEGRYLVGEYCRAHRWFGMVHAGPTGTLAKVLLGATAFGIIYSVLSLLAGTRDQDLDPNDELEVGNAAQFRRRD